MNKGRRRPGEVKKLFDKGEYREAKPISKMLSGRKHRVVFSTQSGFIRLLHQCKVDVIRDIAISPQLLHRQGRDDAAYRRRPLGRSLPTTRLTGGSHFLTFRHSTSNPKEERKKKKLALRSASPKPYTKLVRKQISPSLSKGQQDPKGSKYTLSPELLTAKNQPLIRVQHSKRKNGTYLRCKS